MFTYETYLLYGALSAEPSECVRFNTNLAIFNTYGLVLGAISLCWAVFSLSSTTVFGASPAAVAPGVHSQPLTLETGDVMSEESPPNDVQRSANVRFIILMALSALYMTMAVT